MMVGNTFYDAKINIMYKVHRKIFVQIRFHGRFCEKIFNVFFPFLPLMFLTFSSLRN